MALARHVHAVHAELADAMLSTLWDMYSSWGLAEEAQSEEEASTASFQDVLHQASHVRQQNQQWAHCLKVASLLLQQLPSARLHTVGAGCFQSIEDVWQCLIRPGLCHAVTAVR